MKTENNLENKSKFFAQYWGQEIAVVTKGSYTNPLGTISKVSDFVISSFNPIVKHKHKLQLTPLSQITDEEALGLAEFQFTRFPELHKIEQGILMVSSYDNQKYLSLYSSDYLRSKGYALPWMDLTVEDLVEYGWVKLKSE